jgi:hypothetical protein
LRTQACFTSKLLVRTNRVIRYSFAESKACLKNAYFQISTFGVAER